MATDNPGGLVAIVTVGYEIAGGGVVESGVVALGGYNWLIPAMSPADKALRCPIAIPAGMVVIVGIPFIENAVAG
jgi:hypothetical protein